MLNSEIIFKRVINVYLLVKYFQFKFVMCLEKRRLIGFDDSCIEKDNKHVYIEHI